MTFSHIKLDDELRQVFRDGQSHSWGELAKLAGRSLGMELLLAGHLRNLVASGEIVKAGKYRYRANG